MKRNMVHLTNFGSAYFQIQRFGVNSPWLWENIQRRKEILWYYVKTLQHPVNLKSKDLRMAKLLITQYGGPDGELSAALRYLNQRFSMPTNKSKALLTDIGTEEMAHVEVIATMVHQIMENASIDEIKKQD